MGYSETAHHVFFEKKKGRIENILRLADFWLGDERKAGNCFPLHAGSDRKSDAQRREIKRGK